MNAITEHVQHHTFMDSYRRVSLVTQVPRYQRVSPTNITKEVKTTHQTRGLIPSKQLLVSITASTKVMFDPD